MPCCHLAVRVEPGGGPELTHLAEGETLRVRADDYVIFAIEYRNARGTAYAYVCGNPYDDPLRAVIVYRRAEPAALASLRRGDEATSP